MLRQASMCFIGLGVLVLQGCNQSSDPVAVEPPCSASWLEAVELKLGTGDGHGHGPDIGSAEWRSVIEFKLGVRDSPSVPNVESEEWCSYIDRLVFRD